MRSVKITDYSHSPGQIPVVHWDHEGDDYQTPVGLGLLLDLGLEEGSTLVCYAPGEALPKDGWETVIHGAEGSTKLSSDAEVALYVNRIRCGYTNLKEGDAYRVQVKRAKPKQAVLWHCIVKQGKSLSQSFSRWFCGTCWDFLSQSQAPTYCVNCGALFTETKDL
jgi:hypothetical protein